MKDFGVGARCVIIPKGKLNIQWDFSVTCPFLYSLDFTYSLQRNCGPKDFLDAPAGS
jgi:hypothetical protein